MPAGPEQAPGAGADLPHEQTLYLAGAVTKMARKPADALPVDDAISDEPHGTGNQIGPAVPFRGTGGGVGPAAFAGAVARSLASCRRGVEGDVGLLWALWPGSLGGNRRPLS